ncbi:MAG TPA: hypothetical protein VGX48_01905, partial [Pyrinomonadaceae bacterium]|nr:hypothetical protein [Pyrinomonadaceae bacterium]
MIKRGGAGLADYAPTYGALAALVLLFVANSLFTPNFFDVNNFRNILLQVATTVLVATGMTLVIATGGIDLSVGAVMAIVSAVAASTLGMGTPAAVLLALAVALGAGLFNGALISGFRIQPIIVTLALLISGRGVAQVLSNGGQLIPFSNASFEYLGKGVVAGVPVQVLVMALAVGMTLVIAAGGIDLSVGSVMAIASAVAATSLDWGAGVAVLIALAAATLVGAFNGALISGFRIQPIIV